MSYANFRASLNIPDYVDDIYVEIRNLRAVDVMVGFFDIDDTAATAAHIPQSKSAYWANSGLRLDLMNQLNTVLPASLVFCNNGMSEFHLHHHPFDAAKYNALSQAEYIDFLYGLSGARMANRRALPPKYPEKLSHYSRWHYDLDWACKCRDIDYFEIRDGQLKTILEITGNLKSENHLLNSINPHGEFYIFNRLGLQQMMLRFLMSALDVQAFFVVHTINLDVFYVFDIGFKKVFSGNQAEYVAWLDQL